MTTFPFPANDAFEALPEETDRRPMTAAEHDAANVSAGFRFIRALAVEKAALDQGLPHSCVRVLAAISYFMNSQTQRAWPGYDRIAEITGYSKDVIERSIRELKKANYLHSERRARFDALASPNDRRALVHYGLCAVAPTDLDALVTDAVMKFRAARTAITAPSHPCRKSGVRTNPTTVESHGSESHPCKSSQADPVNFPRQEPYWNEPLKKEREGGGERRWSCNIEDAHLDRFSELYTTWGSERSIILAPINRDLTDGLLASELAVYGDTPPDIIRQAFLLALNTTSAKSYDNRSEESRPGSGGGGSAMLGYFRKVLRSEIGNIGIASVAVAAKAASERAVQEVLHQKRIDGLAASANSIPPRSSRGRSSRVF